MIFRAILLAHGAAAAYLLLAGAPRGWPMPVRATLALCALMPVLGYWLWPRPAGIAVARGRHSAGWLDRLSIGAVAAMIASAFVWLLGAAPDPLESVSLLLEEQLRPQAAGARREAQQNHARPQQGNWLWNNHSRRPLPKRTDFKPGNRPEIFLRLRDRADAAELLQGQAYVRAFALGRYDHASWSISPGPPERLVADAAGLVQLSTPARPPILHEIYHTYDPQGQNVLTALQGVAAVQIPELTRLDDGLYLLPPPLKPSGYEYVASSAPLRLEDLPEAPDLPPAPNAPAELLQGPESAAFAARVRNLAVIASGTGTTQQRLLNLRNHLRTTLKYSLTCDNPRDLDPIDNFLFDEQRGHCEYFATAGALLARAIGIPARIAYGWAGGTYYESGNMFVFRAREAHAWTEVWIAGRGWVVFDPTPADRGSGATVAPPNEPPPTADPTMIESPEETAVGTATADIARWITLGLALPALALLLWRGFRRRRENEGAPDAPSPETGTPHYFTAWRRAAARRGMPMPGGVTLRRHLESHRHPVPFAAELLAYHYAVRYQGAEADPRAEKRLTAAIRRWERQRAEGGPPPT